MPLVLRFTNPQQAADMNQIYGPGLHHDSIVVEHGWCVHGKSIDAQRLFDHHSRPKRHFNIEHIHDS